MPLTDVFFRVFFFQRTIFCQMCDEYKKKIVAIHSKKSGYILHVCRILPKQRNNKKKTIFCSFATAFHRKRCEMHFKVQCLALEMLGTHSKLIPKYGFPLNIHSVLCRSAWIEEILLFLIAIYIYIYYTHLQI